MIDGTLAPHFKLILVETMKGGAYLIAVDGSNDSGLKKVNPMTVRVYESSTGRIVTRFLDMCTTTGELILFLAMYSFNYV